MSGLGKRDVFAKLRSSAQSTPEALIIDKCGTKEILPIISNTLTHDFLFRQIHQNEQLTGMLPPDYPVAQKMAHQILADIWAVYNEVPAGITDLASTSQYRKVMKEDEVASEYIRFLSVVVDELLESRVRTSIDTDLAAKKWRFSDKLTALRKEGAALIGFSFPEQRKENPFLLLAQLGLPVYITTSHHKLLEMALEKVGYRPQVRHFRWRYEEGEPDEESEHRPTESEPVVYHLHGLDTDPGSMVLTEDDHLEFLVALHQNHNLFPPYLQTALNESTLLMLGYQPDAWDFKILFQGLIKRHIIARKKRGLGIKNVYVQVSDADEEIKRFVMAYLKQARFAPIFKKPIDFLHQICDGVKGGSQNGFRNN